MKSAFPQAWSVIHMAYEPNLDDLLFQNHCSFLQLLFHAGGFCRHCIFHSQMKSFKESFQGGGISSLIDNVC
jgi:hypothetical protein